MKQLATPFPQDPIYKEYIPYSKLHQIVIEVANTKIFQRLRNIRHSGHKPVTHTRFEHSVGTALIASHLHNSEEHCHADEVHYTLAALLHDVGHGAFSHVPEMAVPICHKDLTKEIILNHPELKAIWDKHGIDANHIVRLAQDKFPGNSITVPRTSGLISIDHLDNTIRDTTRRAGAKTSGLIQRVIEKAHIDQRGQIVVPEEDIALSQAMLRLSIMQNAEVVFGAQEILFDKIIIIMIQQLTKQGILTTTDLKHTDSHLISILSSPEARSVIDGIYYRLLDILPTLTNEQAEAAITKTSNTPIGITEDPEEHSVGSTYLFTIPPANGSMKAQTDKAREKINEQLIGTYQINWGKILTQAA